MPRCAHCNCIFTGEGTQGKRYCPICEKRRPVTPVTETTRSVTPVTPEPARVTPVTPAVTPVTLQKAEKPPKRDNGNAAADDKQALRDERNALLSRLAEINRRLGPETSAERQKRYRARQRRV